MNSICIRNNYLQFGRYDLLTQRNVPLCTVFHYSEGVRSPSFQRRVVFHCEKQRNNIVALGPSATRKIYRTNGPIKHSSAQKDLTLPQCRSIYFAIYATFSIVRYHNSQLCKSRVFINAHVVKLLLADFHENSHDYDSIYVYTIILRKINSYIILSINNICLYKIENYK